MMILKRTLEIGSPDQTKMMIKIKSDFQVTMGDYCMRKELDFGDI